MRISVWVGLAAAIITGCSAANPVGDPNNDALATLYPDQPNRSAADIMRSAHAAAGGQAWVRPDTLSMDGYAVFYRDGAAVRNERHTMFRVYDAGKEDARRADGKVRITSVRDGVPLIDLAYDGTTTSTAQGPQPQSESDKRWASNFGFGVIRHALDSGYRLSRLPDDLIDGRPAYWIRVTDPARGKTQFAIAQDNHAILSVAFDTDRGWHERIYSDFYSNPGVSWVQPRRVRLYYDGVKANEVIWTRHMVNADLPDCLFILPQSDECFGPFDSDPSAP